MRVFNLISWAFAAAAGVAAIRTTASVSGVEALVRRRLPQHAESFRFQIVDEMGDGDVESEDDGERVNDTYVVSSSADGKVLVKGNTAGALFAGYV